MRPTPEEIKTNIINALPGTRTELVRRVPHNFSIVSKYLEQLYQAKQVHVPRHEFSKRSKQAIPVFALGSGEPTP